MMAEFYTLSFTANEVKLLTDSSRPVGTFCLQTAGDFYVGADAGMTVSDGVKLSSAANANPLVLVVSSPDEVYVLNDTGTSATLKVLHNR